MSTDWDNLLGEVEETPEQPVEEAVTAEEPVVEAPVEPVVVEKKPAKVKKTPAPKAEVKVSKPKSAPLYTGEAVKSPRISRAIKRPNA